MKLGNYDGAVGLPHRRAIFHLSGGSGMITILAHLSKTTDQHTIEFNEGEGESDVDLPLAVSHLGLGWSRDSAYLLSLL